MVKIVNIKKYEDALKEFLRAGDFSRPFIVAGWNGIGKSAIAESFRKEYPNLEIRDFDLTSWNEETAEMIAKEWNTTSCIPRVLCITTGLDMSILRHLVLKYHCLVYLLELDTVLWLEWAKAKDENGKQHIQSIILEPYEANHDLIDKRIPIIKETEKEIDNIIGFLTKWKTPKMEELLEAMRVLFEIQQVAYIDKSTVEKQWVRVIEGWKPRMSEFPPETLSNVQMKLMTIMGEVPELFF